MKTVWIVSGGAEAVPGILRAKDMGLHVVVSDGSPHAPGFAYSDDKVIASTYDVEATTKAARHYSQHVRPLDGVLCVAADVPLTVASVASDLGLPGVSMETARLATDKLAMKECFLRAGIPIPWFSPVQSAQDLKRQMDNGRLLVVKPVDSRGARGVLRLLPEVDPIWAYEQALQSSPTGRVMVEEYLDGPQISTETLILDGAPLTPWFSDRNYEFIDRFAPHVIENGDQQPSMLGPEERRAVTRCAESAALSMGIRNGVAKGDMVLTSQGPKVIEIAARLSGGWFSTDQIPLGTGVDLIGAAIRLAIGDPVVPADLIPKFERGVAIRYFFPPPGRVSAIRGIDEAKRLAGVHRLLFFVRPGELLAPVTNHTKRAGFVITTGSTRQEAIDRALAVIGTIRIEIVPEKQ